MIQFRPTEDDLKTLKFPLGNLFPGEARVTIPRLKKLVEQTRPPFIVAVGDVVSRETQSAGVPVNLRIVDHRTMRKSLEHSEYNARTVYRAANPAGVITQESWDAIKNAMTKRDSILFIDGEEDLLALPCIVECENNSLVVYGQPSEGMVVVKVSPRIKAKVNNILRRALREETH